MDLRFPALLRKVQRPLRRTKPEDPSPRTTHLEWVKGGLSVNGTEPANVPLRESIPTFKVGGDSRLDR